MPRRLDRRRLCSSPPIRRSTRKARASRPPTCLLSSRARASVGRASVSTTRRSTSEQSGFSKQLASARRARAACRCRHLSRCHRRACTRPQLRPSLRDVHFQHARDASRGSDAMSIVHTLRRSDACRAHILDSSSTGLRATLSLSIRSDSVCGKADQCAYVCLWYVRVTVVCASL